MTHTQKDIPLVPYALTQLISYRHLSPRGGTVSRRNRNVSGDRVKAADPVGLRQLDSRCRHGLSFANRPTCMAVCNGHFDGGRPCRASVEPLPYVVVCFGLF